MPQSVRRLCFGYHSKGSPSQQSLALAGSCSHELNPVNNGAKRMILKLKEKK
jgi:hypothetical protein